MVFKIYFSTKRYTTHSVNIVKKVGIKQVDFAREQLCLPELSSKIISDNDISFVENLLIDIPEEMARKSGHFSETTYIHVYVPEKYLNRFMKIEIKDTQIPETGEITNVKFKFVPDKNEIMNWWENAGFPLDVEEEEKKSE